MNIFQAIILGTVQGLTEFLPVSSSGHLVIFQKLFKMAEPPVIFDILLHLASLLAIVVYFQKPLKKIFLKTLSASFSLRLKSVPKITWLIIVATVPAAIAGIFLNKIVEIIFNSLFIVGFGFITTAILLLSISSKTDLGEKRKKLGFGQVLIIGLFQALAILPGVSRSGATVSSGVLAGATRRQAFNFSFYLAIPAILGAVVLQLKNFKTNEDLLSILLGFAATFATSLWSLKFFETVFLQRKTNYFAFYCLFLGVLTLVFDLFFKN